MTDKKPSWMLPFKYRIGSKNKQGTHYICMPYIDARDVQDYLDQTYWEMNRQRKHEHKDWIVYCSIGIRDPKTGEWIRKEDVGDKTAIAKDKWASSDSFKRSAVNRGIGRFLYSMPTFMVPTWTTWDITTLFRTTSPYKEKLKERFEKQSIKMEDMEQSKYQDEDDQDQPKSMDDMVNISDRDE